MELGQLLADREEDQSWSRLPSRKALRRNEFRSGIPEVAEDQKRKKIDRAHPATEVRRRSAFVC